MQLSQTQEDIQGITLARCSTGREGASTLIVLPGTEMNEQEAQALAEPLRDEFTVFVLTSAPPSVDKVLPYVDTFSRALAAHKIKRATLFGLGAGSAVAQAVAVMYPKVIRRLVLLNPTARMAPGLFTRIIDRVESFLPLGLPLRPLSDDFDSRPMLHRIRCPVLILVSGIEGEFVRNQGKYIAEKIPNSWLQEIADAGIGPRHELSDELSRYLVDFLQVPPKRPQ